MGSLFLYPWIPTPPDRAAGPSPPKLHMHTTDRHPAKFCRQRSSSDFIKVKIKPRRQTAHLATPWRTEQYLSQKPAPLDEKGATSHESLAPAMRAADGERHPPANPTKSKPLTPWAQYPVQTRLPNPHRRSSPPGSTGVKHPPRHLSQRPSRQKQLTPPRVRHTYETEHHQPPSTILDRPPEHAAR